MPIKVSMIFQYASSPQNPAVASVHTGGWSETLWSILAAGTPLRNRITNWAQRRSLLLGSTVSIIGYRLQEYTLNGNRLIPGGTSAAALRYPGFPGSTTDIPQMSIEVKSSATDKANSRKANLRGVIDGCVTGGEWNPNPAYDLAMTAYLSLLQNGQWYFPGRDLSQPTMRVVTVEANVLRVDLNLGVVVGDYVRFLRVRDVDGLPVSGSYRVSAVAGNALTLDGLKAGLVVPPNGTVRKDVVAMCQIASAEVTRVNVRKIGRPTEGYRGRRSKRR